GSFWIYRSVVARVGRRPGERLRKDEGNCESQSRAILPFLQSYSPEKGRPLHKRLRLTARKRSTGSWLATALAGRRIRNSIPVQRGRSAANRLLRIRVPVLRGKGDAGSVRATNTKAPGKTRNIRPFRREVLILASRPRTNTTESPRRPPGGRSSLER